jgi:citrate synthase
MADKAFLELEGKRYEFPLVKGSEGEVGIDIKTLRAQTGAVTLDPGYKNTGSCQSAITFLDGEKGELRYRGYAIDELAEKASFLEVAYLLIFGLFPTSEQLQQFEADIKNESTLDPSLVRIIDSFPSTAHPMGVLASATSALIAFNPSAVNVASEEAMYRAIVKIMAKFPIMVAYAQRKLTNQPFVESDTSLGYIENFAAMMFKSQDKEYQQNPIITDALNKLLFFTPITSKTVRLQRYE